MFLFCFILFSFQLKKAEIDDFNCIIKNNEVTISKYKGQNEKVLIPDKINDIPVTEIGDSSFIENQKIKNVILPDSIRNIQRCSFENCINLEEITLSQNLEFIGERAFSKTGLISINFPESLKTISASLFFNCKKLVNVYNTKNIDTLSNRLFYGCSSLTNFTIPDSVIKIGAYSFFECISLSNINIPNKVETIYGDAFNSCISLKVLNVPDNVLNIYSQAFLNCSSLTTVILSKKMVSIDYNVFRSCSSLITIDIPENIQTIKLQAFARCTSLINLKIPNNLSVIEDYAFNDCIHLTTIYIPKTVTSIGYKMFENCPLLTVYVDSGSYAEQYAKTNKLKYAYYFESVSLLVKLISNSNITDIRVIFKDTLTNIVNNMVLVNSNICKFSRLNIDSIFNLTIENRYGMILYENNLFTLTLNETEINVSLPDIYNLNVKIYDDESNIVTSKTCINWYDNNNNYLSQEPILYQIPIGTKVYYEIILDKELSAKYYNVQKQEYIVTYKNDIIISLSKFKTFRITGQITNETKYPVVGSSILISQMLNGEYPHNILELVNDDGVFFANIYNFSTTITISQSDYLTKTIILDNINQDQNLGNICLSKIEGKQIFLDIKYFQSVKENEVKTPIEYYNPQDLIISISNSNTNEIISDFIYQYPYLIFKDRHNSNVQIQINVSSNSDDFHPVSISSRIDSKNISITLVEKGIIQISYKLSLNTNNVALIYSSEGRLISKHNFRTNSIKTSSLNDGKYTVIVIGKRDYSDQIQSLNRLLSLKLQNNIDFVSTNTSVQKGMITTIHFEEIPHFDESKFYFIDDSQSVFTVQKVNEELSMYFWFSGHVEFKKQYKSEVKNLQLLIEFPSNCSILDDSLFADRNSISFTFTDNKMIIPISSYSSIIRFCVVAFRTGKYKLDIFAQFEHGGKTIVQPIKSSEFESELLTFYLPEKTGRKTVRSFGSALPNSKIEIYDNDVLVGQTFSNIIGDWILQFNLFNPSTYSNHYVYIKSITNLMAEATSTVYHLIYNKNYVDVSNITLCIGKKKYTSDYPISNKKLPYSLVSIDNYYTILINFDKNDPKFISNVKLIIFTLSNSVYNVPALFDEQKKIWIAQKYLNTPITSIIVSYECKDDLIIPPEDFDNLTDVTEEEIKEYEKSFDELEFKTEKVKYNFSSIKHQVKYKFEVFDDENTNEQENDNDSNTENKPVNDSNNEKKPLDKKSLDIGKFCDITNEIDIIFVTDEDIYEELHNDDYERFLDSNGNEHFLNIYKGSIFGYTHIDPTKKIIQKIIYSIIDTKNKLMASKPSKIFKLLKKIIKKIEKAKKYGKYYYDYLVEIKNVMKNFDCIPILKLIEVANDAILFFTVNTVLSASELVTKQSKKVSWFIKKVHGPFVEEQIRFLRKTVDKYGCEKVTPTPMPFPVIPIIDPSGYVYEAVESNRVEGVLTTVFYKTTKIDIFGEEYETSEFWNAEDFGQENPLITDSLGWYQWDVPKGLWQVKYEKQYYETGYSKWLPVPPPQLDVNVPIISYLNPEIKRITGYITHIEIEFSKYMKLETLNFSNINISRNKNIIDGKLYFANSEKDPNKSGSNYSSLIHFIPKENFKEKEIINVFIKREVESYSGSIMSDDFNENVEIMIEPQIILDSKVMNITYGIINEMKYLIKVTPFDTKQKKRILLKLSNDYVINLKSYSYDIGEDGNVEIPFTLEYPGVVQIEMMLEGTAIKSYKTINVFNPKVKLDQVESSLENNSIINSDTVINLFNNNDESTIYFSFNDPSLTNLQIYNQSIVITKNSVLYAISRHEDYLESVPSIYNYTMIHIFTVLFNPNGGTVDILSKKVKEKEIFGDLPVPIRQSCTFDGWFTNLKWETKITNETLVTYSNDITLYAKWINDILETPENKSKNSNNKMIIIGISVGCAAAVVIIVVITVIVIIIRKKKMKVSPTDNQTFP